jgi:hypothetical protein
MQGPHGFSKRLLNGRLTGDLEVTFTRRIRRRGTSIRACLGLKREREKSGGEKKYANSLACHSDNLPAGSAAIEQNVLKTALIQGMRGRYHP